MAERGVRVAASARSRPQGSLHANITFFPLDVTDAAAVEACISQIEGSLGAIDLVVLSAGTYEPFEVSGSSAAIFQQVNAVNYIGVTNCVCALIKRMMVRRGGHISWFASVTGYGGLPKAAYYGPTKAALINLAECLKPELEPFGITVSVINPGFVETPMTSVNDFPMPFLMSATDAARSTIAGLEKGRFEVAYPLVFVLVLKVLRLLPYNLYFALMRRLRRR
jgi:short-subunit dehydrogenase